MTRMPALAILLGGCSIGEVNMTLNGDADGDGFMDFDEADGNTDPNDAADHPYQAGWPIDACRYDLPTAGTGAAVGDVAADFALMDQFGETVHLHDFCGQAIILDVSASWCGSCQAAAPEMQSLYEEYASKGFIVITLLGENLDSEAPTQDDLVAWADQFSLTYPVLADPGYAYGFLYEKDYGIPSETLLKAGAELVELDGYGLTSSDVEPVLPE